MTRRIAKALLVSRIKENAKQKPHGWDKPKSGSIKMADGGIIPSFDQTQPVDSGAPPFEATQPITSNGGLSSYIPKAISDIPHEAFEATANQIRNIGKAWTDMRDRRAE